MIRVFLNKPFISNVVESNILRATSLTATRFCQTNQNNTLNKKDADRINQLFENTMFCKKCEKKLKDQWPQVEHKLGCMAKSFLRIYGSIFFLSGLLIGLALGRVSEK